VDDPTRLFLRNLSFMVREDDLKKLMSKYGEIKELHIPVDKKTQNTKGLAFVQFTEASAAAKALTELDGSIFQGRLMHIIPAKMKFEIEENEEAGFKKKKEKELKENAGSSHNWNSFFMNSDAVAQAIAAKFGVTKAQVLDRESNDNLAVRLALAETQIINDTKKMLVDQGVNLEKLGSSGDKKGPRSDVAIIVKNIPYEVEIEDLTILFGNFGTISRLILPPVKTIAIVEFLNINDAKKAFRSLAYKLFKSIPLYLEWAPANIFDTPPPAPVVVKEESEVKSEKANQKMEKKRKAEEIATDTTEAEKEEEEAPKTKGCTLFVKNLNFATTDESLRTLFQAIGEVRSATVAKKKDMKRQGQMLSMGFGFVEMKTPEAAMMAMRKIQGAYLDGHVLSLQFSEREGKAKKETSEKRDPGKAYVSSTKLVVKNVAFEVKRKDLQDLFKPFGQVKSVRIPKQVNNKTRGFAFVEFLTKQEAENAKEALKDTHLYGRHLVIDYAQEDNDDVEQLRKKQALSFQ